MLKGLWMHHLSGRPVMTPGVQSRKILIIVPPCSGLVRIQMWTGWLKGKAEILVSRSVERTGTTYFPDSASHVTQQYHWCRMAKIIRMIFMKMRCYLWVILREGYAETDFICKTQKWKLFLSLQDLSSWRYISVPLARLKSTTPS